MEGKKRSFPLPTDPFQGDQDDVTLTMGRAILAIVREVGHPITGDEARGDAITNARLERGLYRRGIAQALGLNLVWLTVLECGGLPEHLMREDEEYISMLEKYLGLR